MSLIGTPYTETAKKVMMLGAGELAREVVVELMRLGCEVIAVDRYENAPAMQVAHRSHVVSMLDGDALEQLIVMEKPDLIVPEIEAIATERLLKLEKEGYAVVPTARATSLTMDREGIRTLAAQELGLKTSPYCFADNEKDFKEAFSITGLPAVVKPVMSSSGKGQSTVKSAADIDYAWNYAKEGARGSATKVIVEGFVDFDYEITLLTISHAGGISFCEPIGHRQDGGDYQESWQPQPMSVKALEEARKMAEKVVRNLGGYGLFGVEFFVKKDVVYFSEISPRPHDTGMVTMISQNLSEFALHARAILGLPVPMIRLYSPSASKALVFEAASLKPSYKGVAEALEEEGTDLRLFSKPEISGHRRMGVVLACDSDIEKATEKATRAAAKINLLP